MQPRLRIVVLPRIPKVIRHRRCRINRRPPERIISRTPNRHPTLVQQLHRRPQMIILIGVIRRCRLCAARRYFHPQRVGAEG